VFLAYLAGADPGILEREGPVRGRNPEPSAGDASAGGGPGGASLKKF